MTEEKKKGLSKLHLQILEVLRSHSEGINIDDIRKNVVFEGNQQHLDKRVRELRDHFQIDTQKDGRYTLYILRGARTDPVSDSGSISSKLRAEILHLAHGRCQMCGRTVAEDNIKLQLDHKIPRNWGGVTAAENLWAICQLCNGGKRDFFATFNDEVMKKIIGMESVYERIAETLKLNLGKPTPSHVLQFVANASEQQDDWQKRLRELRYPVIGMKIKSGRKKNERGYWEATYTLSAWIELPVAHKKLIKDFERKNRRKREYI